MIGPISQFAATISGETIGSPGGGVGVGVGVGGGVGVGTDEPGSGCGFTTGLPEPPPPPQLHALRKSPPTVASAARCAGLRFVVVGVPDPMVEGFGQFSEQV